MVRDVLIAVALAWVGVTLEQRALNRRAAPAKPASERPLTQQTR